MYYHIIYSSTSNRPGAGRTNRLEEPREARRLALERLSECGSNNNNNIRRSPSSLSSRNSRSNNSINGSSSNNTVI